MQNSNIYVQAGAFALENNALNLSQKLSSIGPSRVYLTNLDGQPFFRVRLGPYTEVARADQALNALIASGNNDALIVVE